MKKRIIIIIMSVFMVLLLTLIIYRIYVDANVIEISHYKIVSDKLNKEFDDFKIIQLSDLHSKSFGKNNKKLMNMINHENPDIIVLTGDMVSANERDFSVFYELIDNLSEKYPIYFITGNHEQGLPRKSQDEIKNYLRNKGVVVLDNESVTITKNNYSFELFGLWYNKMYYSKKSGVSLTDERIINFIGKPKQDSFNLLLTHNPSNYEAYSKWGADLTLSGHIHGGMIRLPFIGAVFSPDEGFFPKYSAGLYESNNSKMIVSRGLGRGSRGFRLFNQPELVIITLKSQD